MPLRSAPHLNRNRDRLHRVIIAYGASAQITDGVINPHSEFIFRVTGTRSCQDCHAVGKKPGPKYGLLDNATVRGLVAKGKGAHGPGRFADCFRCHAGGRVGAERGS
ncbi:MAG: hypothetical protein ACKOCD_11785 [Nitrospiraceae bacterium]